MSNVKTSDLYFVASLAFFASGHNGYGVATGIIGVLALFVEWIDK